MNFPEQFSGAFDQTISVTVSPVLCISAAATSVSEWKRFHLLTLVATTQSN
jgi:hypothetical protein